MGVKLARALQLTTLPVSKPLSSGGLRLQCSADRMSSRSAVSILSLCVLPTFHGLQVLRPSRRRLALLEPNDICRAQPGCLIGPANTSDLVNVIWSDPRPSALALTPRAG